MQNWKVTSYAARSHKREHNQKTQMPPGRWAPGTVRIRQEMEWK